MKVTHLQALKLILGFLSGVVLLMPFAFHVLLGLTLSEGVQMLLITSAIAAFGVSAHGAFKMQPGDGEKS